MVAALEQAAARRGVSVDVGVSHEYTAYSLRPDDPLLGLLAAGAAEVGIEPAFGPTGGGSDANVFNAAGIRVTNISTGMDRVHTTSEQIAVADMVRAAEWLLACLRLRAQGRA